MKWRWLILDEYGEVYGTNEESLANSFIGNQDQILIDVDSNTSSLGGKSEMIREYDPEPRE